MDEKYVGVVEDPRSDFQKSFDYRHESLVMGDIPIFWKEKTESEWRKFLIRNQDGSSACVSFATAKILGIHEVIEGRPFKDLSPKFIYTRRQNYPDGGMWLPNALSIACKDGACDEKMLPCDFKDEEFMNDKGQETQADALNATQYKAKFYFEIKSRSIDEIAKVIQQGYGVLLGMRFDYSEWTDVPAVDPASKNSCGHGVPAIDYFMYNGEKALLIEDSWGPHYGKGGHRIITETFLNSKCFYAGYITSLPNYIFTKRLQFGSRGVDVKMLQVALNKVNSYPVDVDGNFGDKTKHAVFDFQVAHQLNADGIVGPKTNAVLNSLR